MQWKKSEFRVNEICLNKLFFTIKTMLLLCMKSVELVINRNLSAPKMPQLKVILALGS
jgi:hypothetical protein